MTTRTRARAALGVVCTLVLGGGCAAPAPREPARPPAERVAPSSAEQWFERARGLAAAGDASRAEQYALLAVRAGLPEERAIGLLLHVCILATRLRAARAHAELFLSRHPDAWRLRFLLSTIDLALGDANAAAVQLRRVLTDYPEVAQAHYLLGVIARDHASDEAAAHARFRAYLAAEPHGRFAADARAFLREHPPADPATDMTEVTP